MFGYSFCYVSLCDQIQISKSLFAQGMKKVKRRTARTAGPWILIALLRPVSSHSARRAELKICWGFCTFATSDYLSLHFKGLPAPLHSFSSSISTTNFHYHCHHHPPLSLSLQPRLKFFLFLLHSLKEGYFLSLFNDKVSFGAEQMPIMSEPIRNKKVDPLAGAP